MSTWRKRCFAKHCQLEGHLSGATVGRGIRPSVSFLSQTRGRISSFCGFSSVPTEVHHHLKQWDKIFGLHLYVFVCETNTYGYISFLCSLLMFFTEWILSLFASFFGSLLLSWVAPHPALVTMLWQQSWGWVRTQPGVSTEGLCCESLASFVLVDLSVCFKPCLGNASKSTWAEGVVTSSRGCEGCRKYKRKGWKLFQPPLSPEDPSHGVTP